MMYKVIGWGLTWSRIEAWIWAHRKWAKSGVTLKQIMEDVDGTYIVRIR